MRVVLALIAIGMIAVRAASAQPAPVPAWLVQVTFPRLPASADPQAYPGRAEVTVRGEFVGCAWAAWRQVNADDVQLVPLALGYAVSGRREDIRVEAFGELNRLGGMVVKITPLAGPVSGLQNPR